MNNAQIQLFEPYKLWSKWIQHVHRRNKQHSNPCITSARAALALHDMWQLSKVGRPVSNNWSHKHRVLQHAASLLGRRHWRLTHQPTGHWMTPKTVVCKVSELPCVGTYVQAWCGYVQTWCGYVQVSCVYVHILSAVHKQCMNNCECAM